ncbi:hypothetical protein MRX96_005317 [Rhipicephalus microplus]
MAMSGESISACIYGRPPFVDKRTALTHKERGGTRIAATALIAAGQREENEKEEIAGVDWASEVDWLRRYSCSAATRGVSGFSALRQIMSEYSQFRLCRRPVADDARATRAYQLAVSAGSG